jgi:hypothetical protein
MYLILKFPNNSKENISLQIFEKNLTKSLLIEITEREVMSDSVSCCFL